jgi:hypothetical protein
MTNEENFNLPAGLLTQFSQQGFDLLPELIQVIINAAIQAEQQQYLKAEPYQHNEERQRHANRFKPKMVHSRVGSLWSQGVGIYYNQLFYFPPRQGCHSAFRVQIVCSFGLHHHLQWIL